MLEKILEEIDIEIEKQKEICLDLVGTPGWGVYENAMNQAKKIIRKHMNDGWIPCEERMPKYRGWKIKVWMTVANGHVVEGFYDREGFKFKNGQKILITVRAWKEKRKPEPYRPEKGEGE